MGGSVGPKRAGIRLHPLPKDHGTGLTIPYSVPFGQQLKPVVTASASLTRSFSNSEG